MSAHIIGPACRHAGCARPVFADDMCRAHWDLARAMGVKVSEPFDSIVLDYRSSEFHNELNAWRDGRL